MFDRLVWLQVRPPIRLSCIRERYKRLSFLTRLLLQPQHLAVLHFCLFWVPDSNYPIHEFILQFWFSPHTDYWLDGWIFPPLQLKSNHDPTPFEKTSRPGPNQCLPIWQSPFKECHTFSNIKKERLDRNVSNKIDEINLIPLFRVFCQKEDKSCIVHMPDHMPYFLKTHNSR